MKLLNEILWPILCRNLDSLILMVALRLKLTNLKKKEKNTSGLSMKGKATDKNLELTKNFKRNGLLSHLSSFGSLS